MKYSVAMVNRWREGPGDKTAYELRKGRKFARALPQFAEKILFMIPGLTAGGRNLPRCVCQKVRTVRRREATGFMTNDEYIAEAVNRRCCGGWTNTQCDCAQARYTPAQGRAVGFLCGGRQCYFFFFGTMCCKPLRCKVRLART